MVIENRRASRRCAERMPHPEADVVTPTETLPRARKSGRDLHALSTLLNPSDPTSPALAIANVAPAPTIEPPASLTCAAVVPSATCVDCVTIHPPAEGASCSICK